MKDNKDEVVSIQEEGEETEEYGDPAEEAVLKAQPFGQVGSWSPQAVQRRQLRRSGVARVGGYRPRACAAHLPIW